MSDCRKGAGAREFVPAVPAVPFVSASSRPGCKLFPSGWCPMGHSLGTVPWDTCPSVPVQLPMDGRSGHSGSVRYVANRHALAVQSLQRVRIVPGLDRADLPLALDEL